MTTSRRKFLRSAAQSGIAAATLAAFPPSIRKALAIPANQRDRHDQGRRSTSSILMQENRSFDHYFGTLKGVRGFGDRFTIPLPGGRSVWEQLDRDRQPGAALPPRRHARATRSASPARRTAGSTASSPGIDGRMGYWPAVQEHRSRWATTRRPSCRSSSRWPTPSRSATPTTARCTPAPTRTACSSGPAPTARPAPAWRRSTTSGTASARRHRQRRLRLDDLSRAPAGGRRELDRLPEHARQLRRQLAGRLQAVPRRQRGLGQARRAPTAARTPAYDPASDDAANPLYKGIANTMPGTRATPILLRPASARTCKNGKLPQVSWIVAPATYSEHPGPSSPVQGAWYIQQVLDALTANPDVWSKTVLLRQLRRERRLLRPLPVARRAVAQRPTARSPARPRCRRREIAVEYFTLPVASRHTGSRAGGAASTTARDGRVYGPGMRVPMYVISPWSRGGWVNSQVFDHTSVIRFLEARFGVKEPNISPFRRAVLRRPDERLQLRATRTTSRCPTLAGRKTKAEADALRAAQQALPQIAPPADRGCRCRPPASRPSRALPYELHVSARMRRAQRHACSCCSPTPATPAAVFHVYDKLQLDAMPSRSRPPTNALLTSATPVPAAAPLHGRARQDAGRRLGGADRQRRPLRPVGARPERLPPPLQGRPHRAARAAARRRPKSA